MESSQGKTLGSKPGRDRISSKEMGKRSWGNRDCNGLIGIVMASKLDMIYPWLGTSQTETGDEVDTSTKMGHEWERNIMCIKYSSIYISNRN